MATVRPPRSMTPSARASRSTGDVPKARTPWWSGPAGTHAMISWAPMSTPAAQGLTLLIPSKDRMSLWEERVRWRVRSLLTAGSCAEHHTTVGDHARSPAWNRVLIGVNATSVGPIGDREPGCRAGYESPVLCRVSTRDRFRLLYTRGLGDAALFLRWGLPARHGRLQATAHSVRSCLAPASRRA
jgi:hypothetical protein